MIGHATAVVGYGLKPKIRTDIFGEEYEDAIIRFGKQHRGSDEIL